MEENTAIEALKQGNLDGLEPLSRLYYFRAVKAAFLIVQSKGEAEDIVQDAFLRAVEKIHQCQPGKFGAWFQRIVINSAIKAVRKRNRLISFEQPAGSSPVPLEEVLRDPHPGQQAAVEASEVKTEIWIGMSMLPSRQRATLVLKYYLEQSEAEIAATMKWPLSTVKWLLYSARKQMKMQLRPDRMEIKNGESK